MDGTQDAVPAIASASPEEPSEALDVPVSLRANSSAVLVLVEDAGVEGGRAIPSPLNSADPQPAAECAVASASPVSEPALPCTAPEVDDTVASAESCATPAAPVLAVDGSARESAVEGPSQEATVVGVTDPVHRPRRLVTFASQPSPLLADDASLLTDEELQAFLRSDDVRKVILCEAKRSFRPRHKYAVYRGEESNRLWCERFPALARIDARLEAYQAHFVLFLIVLGMVVACVCYGLESLVTRLVNGVNDAMDATSSWGAQYAVFVCVNLCLFAAAYAVTQLLGPAAAGSGIPEMKAVLFGVELRGLFSVRTGLAKFFGLVLVSGARLSVGMEGPFVHISGVIATVMMAMPWFRAIGEDTLFRRHALSAACSAGVTSLLLAPISGILFSVEVTSIFFLIRSYLHSAIAAMAASVVTWLLYKSVVFPTYLPEPPFSRKEAIAFVLIGVVGGIGGAAFVRFADALSALRNRYLPQGTRRLLFASLAIVACMLVCQYPWAFWRDTISQQITLLLTRPKLSGGAWGGMNVYGGLVLALFGRFVSTALMLNAPVPSGVLFPSLLMGASFGRLVGQIAHDIDGTSVPETYAVVGAGAFMAGVTRAVSSAFVMIELTWQPPVMLPIFVAVVCSILAGNQLSPSVYDAIRLRKGLPHPPPERREWRTRTTAKEMMISTPHCVPRNTTLRALASLLASPASAHSSYPFVDGADRLLIGAVSWDGAVRALVRCASGWRLPSHDAEGADAKPPGRDSIWLELNGGFEGARGTRAPGPDDPIDMRTYLAAEDVDSSPLQVPTGASMGDIQELLSLLGADRLLVVARGGRLAGIITRKMFLAEMSRADWH